MTNPWTVKLGIFGCLFLVAACALPFHWLGLSDNASIIGGLGLSLLVLGFVYDAHRDARIEEMREGSRDAHS